MGADCHDFYIEQERFPGSWWFVGQVNTDRDYIAFGLLAGVRREDLEHIPPRGYPTGLSYQTGEHASGDDCHSASWLTTDEMVEAQRRYVRECRYPPYPALEYAIVMMRQAEANHPGKPVRAVFCFDN